MPLRPPTQLPQEAKDAIERIRAAIDKEMTILGPRACADPDCDGEHPFMDTEDTEPVPNLVMSDFVVLGVCTSMDNGGVLSFRFAPENFLRYQQIGLLQTHIE